MTALLTTLLWFLLAMLCLVGVAFFCGIEMGLYSLNRLRLRLRVGRSGDSAATTLLELSDHREESIASVLLMQNVMNYFLTVAAISLMWHAAGIQGTHADIMAAVILSPITFVLGDVIPKEWFRTHADRLMYPAARFIKTCTVLMRSTGILWLLKSITRFFTRLAGQEQGELWRGARSEMMGLLRETAATGTLTEEQTRMIERVMNLSNVCVGNIMVPRSRVVRLPHDINRKVFEMIVRRHDFSRLPVLTPDRRDVAGILNVYDVLLDNDPNGPILKRMRPAITISAGTSAMQALLQLRQAHEAMSIVTDPRRGFVGIVTLKDLVEEIFGELAAW